VKTRQKTAVFPLHPQPRAPGRFILDGHRYVFAATNRHETDSCCLIKADLTIQDESGETALHLAATRRHEAVEDVDKGGVGEVGVGDLCEVVRQI
jgi:hypothetical protein